MSSLPTHRRDSEPLRGGRRCSMSSWPRVRGAGGLLAPRLDFSAAVLGRNMVEWFGFNAQPLLGGRLSDSVRSIRFSFVFCLA